MNPRWFSTSLVVCLAVAGVSAKARAGLIVTNLVTDDQTVNAALLTDVSLKNPWGISRSTTSPFWVSVNGSGVATLYQIDPHTDAPTKLALTVTIPDDGTVTGQAFSNTAANFNGDAFLFVSEDGTISGWRGALGTSAERLTLPSPDNVYKGTALATIGANSYLLSANFHSGSIDVLKGNAGAPDLAGKFTDPALPNGFAPFNIQNLGGKIYVTYAVQDAAKHDDVPGAGNGIVSVFDLNGTFLGRVATHGTLDSPWGLALAPSSFGSIGGDLLVGNFGDGRIYAYNSATFPFHNDGPLTDAVGNPIAIDGLWDLIGGNDGQAGSSDRIYFSAGSNGEADGLFGSIAPVPEPGTLTLSAVAGAFVLAMLVRRSR